MARAQRARRAAASSSGSAAPGSAWLSPPCRPRCGSSRFCPRGRSLTMPPSCLESTTMPTAAEAGPIRRVLVATDRSESADRAVRWAAKLAESHGAELILFQVLPPAAEGAAERDRERLAGADTALRRFAQELAGSRGLGRVVVHEDPSLAILDGIDAEQADVVVVGNVGMSGRRQF